MPTQDIILGYAKGKPGNAATVEIGTTTTLEPGSQATVNNSGNENAAVFNFGIPKGEEGKAASIMIDSIQTLQPEENATVENVGTTSDVSLKFGIPRGADGMTDLVARYEDASEYTATPTADAPIVINDLNGKTQQTQTNGYQLFDASKIQSKTQGGATVTNNGDGSFTISGSGNVIETFVDYYTNNNIVKNLIPGILKLFIEKNDIYPYFYCELLDSDESIVKSVTTSSLSTNLTEDDISKIVNIRFGFYGSVGINIVPGTIKPMLYQDGDGIWEPFSGGVASPSPEWEQRIAGVGDSGFFDGNLQKGYYNASGVYTSADNYVCTVNKIECKQSDNINVELEATATSIIVSFFQSSGTFISQQTGSGKSLTATAPANAGYCMISINRASIEPQTAGHISVTINGKYASRVESNGKNLAKLNVTNDNQIKEGVTLKFNDKKGCYTLNGTCTKNAVFLLNQALGDDVINFPVIKILKKGKKYRIKDCQLNIRNSSYPNGSTLGLNAMNNNIFYTPTEDTEIVGIRALTEQGKTYSETKEYYPGIWEDETETDDKWEPYRSTSIQFPLTNPLYDGDKICYVKPGKSYIDENGDTVVADRMLYGHYHENGRVVFDGSEDEAWSFQTNYNNRASFILNNSNNVFTNATAKCNLFKYNSDAYYDTKNEIGFAIAQSGLLIRFGIESEVNSLEALKTWLQSNNLEVVYKLAQPWFEPFEDQTPFYNLRSFDNLTYIYSNDLLNPILTVDVAKNQTGGYIFESLAQAMKNAQKAEAMKSIESRLQALESQAVENI